jgi:hypothetical protein
MSIGHFLRLVLLRQFRGHPCRDGAVGISQRQVQPLQERETARGIGEAAHRDICDPVDHAVIALGGRGQRPAGKDGDLDLPVRPFLDFPGPRLACGGLNVRRREEDAVRELDRLARLPPTARQDQADYCYHGNRQDSKSCAPAHKRPPKLYLVTNLPPTCPRCHARTGRQSILSRSPARCNHERESDDAFQCPSDRRVALWLPSGLPISSTASRGCRPERPWAARRRAAACRCGPRISVCALPWRPAPSRRRAGP